MATPDWMDDDALLRLLREALEDAPEPTPKMIADAKRAFAHLPKAPTRTGSNTTSREEKP